MLCIAVQDSYQLLTSNRIVRSKGRIAVTADNAIIRSPGHRLGVPGAGRHVGEDGLVLRAAGLIGLLGLAAFVAGTGTAAAGTTAGAMSVIK